MLYKQERLEVPKKTLASPVVPELYVIPYGFSSVQKGCIPLGSQGDCENRELPPKKRKVKSRIL